jgi:carboxyl-terminal processing protease
MESRGCPRDFMSQCSTMKRARWALLALALSAFLASAQTRIPLEDRLWVASKIYASIPIYFAHWQAAPDLDLDAAYKDYLKAATAADTRWDFDHLTLEFMARLRNGHTYFWDSFLDKAGGPPVGFLAVPIEGKWTVVESYTAKLKIGDVIETIDRIPFERFFQDKRRYIAVSSEAAAKAAFLYHKHLFRNQFRLQLSGGAEVAIDRFTDKLVYREPPGLEARWIEPTIAYIRIPSFAEPKFEDFAIAAFKQYGNARAVVVDVRDNGGGATPVHLLRAIMDRPYRDWSQASALSIGLFRAHGHRYALTSPGELSEREAGFLDALSQFAAPQLLAPGTLVPPAASPYRGRIVVLTGFACTSACEDFVMPLKYSKRATIVGERTRGSSGQPFIYDFGNGMSVHISSRRMYFPDGSEFEGVGIAPDIAVQPSVADRRNGVDVVLDRAMRLLSGQ